jgi:hypothetical protein
LLNSSLTLASVVMVPGRSSFTCSTWQRNKEGGSFRGFV